MFFEMHPSVLVCLKKCAEDPLGPSSDLLGFQPRWPCNFPSPRRWPRPVRPVAAVVSPIRALEKCHGSKIGLEWDVLKCLAKTDNSNDTVNRKRHVSTTFEELVGVILYFVIV